MMSLLWYLLALVQVSQQYTELNTEKLWQKSRQDIYKPDGSIIEAVPPAVVKKLAASKEKIEVFNAHLHSDLLWSEEPDGMDTDSSAVDRTPRKSRVKRKVLKSSIHGQDTWPANIIPYRIDLATYSSVLAKFRIRHAVQLSIKTISEISCITFIEKDDVNQTIKDRIGHNHYIRIFNGVDCWSHVGCAGCKIKNSRYNTYQDMSITEECSQATTVQHELGHVLGLTHEHTRTDMHKYITVNYSHITTPEVFYRKPHPEFINFAPYDISSIQHYKNDAILTNDPEDMWLKSGTGALTHYDKWSINAAHCSDGCQYLKCQNDGYVTNKDGSCKCICPDGLSGRLCERSDSIEQYKCGGVIQLGSSPYTLTIATAAMSTSKCSWLFKAPDGKYIETKASNLNLPYDNSGCKHFISVRDRLLGQVSREKCGKCTGVYCFTSVSHSNSLIILYEGLEKHYQQTGFTLTLTVKDDCHKCKGAPCSNGVCKYKTGDLRCGFESGLLDDCSDIKMHDEYQKSYEDQNWTEASWEVATEIPAFGRVPRMNSAVGRLHLQSIRPPPLTAGPYEGVVRIVPYLIPPGQSRCLEFQLFLCCDRQSQLRVYTAVDGQLSRQALITTSNPTNEWRHVSITVQSPNSSVEMPVEIVFIASHSVSAEAKAHLGIDDLVWKSEVCR